MKLTKHKKWFQSKTVDALDQHAVRITMLTVVSAPSGPVLYPRNPVCTLGPLRNASKKHGEDNGDTPVNQAETPVRYTYWLLFSRHNSGSKNLIPKTRLSQNYENYHKKRKTMMTAPPHC